MVEPGELTKGVEGAGIGTGLPAESIGEEAGTEISVFEVHRIGVFSFRVAGAPGQRLSK